MIAGAFNAKSGPLRDTQAPDAERQAMMRLMSGAHGVFKVRIIGVFELAIRLKRRKCWFSQAI